MKLNEIKEAGKLKGDTPKMGYVGAFTYAEVVSGYTSFYLGAKSVCPDVTMDVTFTGSWYDETAEKEGANKLIQGGCDLISQHADSMGAPTACEEAGIPDVSYNGSTKSAAPNTYIISSRINWSPYYEFVVNAVKNGEEIPADWTGTIETGSVELTELNTDVAAEGTAEKIEEVKAGLADGSIHVFDCAAISVEGKPLDNNVLYGVTTYFAIYIVMIAVTFMMLSFEPNFNFEANITASVSCCNNVGPGLGLVGPMAGYGGYSNFSKLILTFAMLLGRLEIYPVLLAFYPKTWAKK